MGLLDDAIREHLELKRLKGADPGEVAREERDALGPQGRDGEAAREDHGEAGVDTDAAAAGQHAAGPEPTFSPDLSTVGEETAELDMSSQLEHSQDLAPRDPPARAGRAMAVGHPAHSDGDSLEWEMPGDETDQPADDRREPADDPEDEDVEDVLEETPDFLRDTPEQDRLWFEQRPPRDFDFNE